MAGVRGSRIHHHHDAALPRPLRPPDLLPVGPGAHVGNREHVEVTRRVVPAGLGDRAVLRDENLLCSHRDARPRAAARGGEAEPGLFGAPWHARARSVGGTPYWIAVVKSAEVRVSDTLHFAIEEAIARPPRGDVFERCAVALLRES